MTARRNRQNATTDRLKVVAGSWFFACCGISILGPLAYVTLAHRLPVRRPPDSARTSSADDVPETVIVATGDPLSGGPVLEMPANQLSDYTFTQIHMAMPVRITVWAQGESQARRAGRAAFQRISDLVQVLSDYQPESELNRLLETGGVGLPDRGRVVSHDLLAVLSYSQEVFRLTGGAFDPSAGPLIELWKQARKAKELPSPSELDIALGRVGFDQIRIDSEAGEVRVLRAGVQLDLGAIAKGYIADSALQVLRDRGIDSACIEAGGDFVVGQSPPGTSGWKIDVPVLGATRLENCGISVSGDTVQFAEIDSIRYSHVVDPRTGKPLTRRVMAVVIAPLAIQSDALATSACILEESEFEQFADGIPGVRFWRWHLRAKDSKILP